jgi:SNF2 family DNA or RNA helicase
VFVQFDGLMKKVGEAFNANKIKYLEIRGSASQKSKALESFQQDSKERVLLLHVTDESASGA